MQNIKNDLLIKEIARQIKELRLSRNLSQEDVYLDTDIHCGRLEQGKNNITVSTLKVLCDYFHISLSEFFNRIEKQSLK